MNWTVRLTHDSQCISSESSPGPQFFTLSHLSFSAMQKPDVSHWNKKDDSQWWVMEDGGPGWISCTAVHTTRKPCWRKRLHFNHNRYRIFNFSIILPVHLVVYLCEKERNKKIIKINSFDEWTFLGLQTYGFVGCCETYSRRSSNRHIVPIKTSRLIATQFKWSLFSIGSCPYT